jgi:tetratricopeptide (TPR) repeat protein
MFGRLAAVRLRSAEEALAEGRLEDALELADAADLAGQRRAQRLLSELAKRFLLRGQDRLLNRHFGEAIADFDRAARCGQGDAAAVDEWRRRAIEAMQDERLAARDRAGALATARQHLDGGRVDDARRAIASAPEGDSEAASIITAIDRQAGRARQALSAAEVALSAEQIDGAVANLRAACSLNGKLEGIAEMEAKVVDAGVRHATDAFAVGRLDRAAQQLAVLGEFGRGKGVRVDIEEALRLAREAASALAEDRYARAGVVLGRLAQFGLKADWIATVREHLAVLDEHRRALLEGPLGLFSGREVPSEVSAQAKGASASSARPPQQVCGQRVAASTEPQEGDWRTRLQRLLLRIDGGGGFLLLQGDRIVIGRAGSGATADLQLVSDLAERQAEIVRVGDDYFLVATGGVELAGQPVDHALLQDGDRIRLGRAARMIFRRPTKKSATAVLDLGDGVRLTNECRRVVLCGGPILMGSGRQCHIRLDPSLGGAILMERRGQWLIRRMGAGEQEMPVALGTAMALGELRFSVQPWSDR